MPEPVERLVAFGRALRDAGLPVGTGRIERFCRAAALVGPRDLYWAGRSTLVDGRDALDVYDRVFRDVFGSERAPAAVRVRAEAEVALAADGTGSGEGDDAVGAARVRASAVEVLRHKSFARCSPEELDRLAELMAGMRLEPPLRRTRRRRTSPAGSLDLRRTLRRSFRTGGEPFVRAWRERRRRPRRLVLVLDVSGSMADYSRGLLLFAHAALHRHSGCDVFCFGTRLTRLTGTLAARDVDDALRQASDEVVDWNGGTRIGDSLARLVGAYPNTVRGAVVVVCSDGLDVGDAAVLGEAMSRLSRLAYSVVWLNPLRESPRYEPLARGMRTALPYVDVFAPGHDLASLEALGSHLRGG